MNARYGPDPGLGFYTHVSDQHGPCSVRVISATSHEAFYVLDGLMHHGTALRIGTHFVDTGGSSDHVFILCAMLGFRFCPRLRDFPDHKLATLEPASAYKTLAPLLGRRIRTEVIRGHWDEILRLVASLRAGTVLPSAMLKRLAAHQRQNKLALALQELGRIERTLFMLDWLESPRLRQRRHAGLNKSEQRHALAHVVCTFKQGRIADRGQEAQQFRASGLNLAIAAIVYWNSTYIATDVVPINSQARERLGYPTQKPIALLDRIIQSSSNPRQIVFDPFRGCGTTIYSAVKNGRQWIGCDIAILSIKLIRELLSERYLLVEGTHFDVAGIPVSVEQAQELFRRDPFQFQHWAVERVDGFPMHKKVADRGIDGRIYFETRDGLRAVMMSVKGGKIRPTDVRDLRGVMEREDDADVAGFISMEEPTKAMREEASRVGMYEYGGMSYPRMQLLTVREILEEKREFLTPSKVRSRISTGQAVLPL